MRYRSLSDTGDYVFGRGALEFLVDSAEAVAQAISTRLRLWEGEWFLDTSEGTPWMTGVLGEGTRPVYDQVLKDRILGTEGVLSIAEYASYLDEQRHLQATALVNTEFGQVGITIGAQGSPGILDVNFILDVSTLG